MASERRTQTYVLAALVVVLAVVTYLVWPGPSAPAPAASNQQTARSTDPARGGNAERGADVARGGDPARGGAQPGDQTRRQTTGSTPEAPDVHLPALEAERPKPVDAERNLFRFRPKPTPPPPPPTAPPVGPMTPAPIGTPTPPPPPPITLKFIGYAEPKGQPKIAWLMDASGHVFEGNEGSVIEGRYKILRIGVESLDISYVDGTGRRTIRLSGG